MINTIVKGQDNANYIPKKGELVTIPISEMSIINKLGDGIHTLNELPCVNITSTVIGNNIMIQIGDNLYITEDGETWIEKHIDHIQFSDISTKVIDNELNLSSDNGETWQPLEEFIDNYANKYSNSDNRIIRKLLGE